MLENKSIFFKKKILIYGLGKSGLSTFNFLKKKNLTFLFDDFKSNITNKEIKKKIINIQNVQNKKFDFIIISPGIDINKCRLSKYLKKNLDKVYSDLDVFYSQYSKNKNITITGTNGKSTTVKILYNLLKDQRFDARLVGNIGHPILSEKNITKSTIFIIEASSYQLEYSKLFNTNFAAILNISPDHLERHRTLSNYTKAKFKLIKNQTKKGFAFLNTKNLYIKKELKKNKFISKIIKINKKVHINILKKIGNPYFNSEANKENLLFILEISKKLNLKKNILFKSLKKFKGLKYRQQIIYRSKNLTIINDSKATSYSSSVSLLKSLSNVYWIVGGIPKQGDKFLLNKQECQTFKVYIFGKNKKYFIEQFKKVIDYQYLKSLNFLVKKVFLDIRKEKIKKNRIILFSPAAASFDSFKNFEDRGAYFNNLIKKLANV